MQKEQLIFNIILKSIYIFIWNKRKGKFKESFHFLRLKYYPFPPKKIMKIIHNFTFQTIFSLTLTIYANDSVSAELPGRQLKLVGLFARFYFVGITE